jgi:hypothetical protein
MRAALLVILTHSLGLAAQAAGPVVHSVPFSLMPVQSWEGTTQRGMPAFGKRTTYVLDDAGAFAARWRAVRPGEKVPEIDFRTCFVVEGTYPGGQFALLSLRVGRGGVATVVGFGIPQGVAIPKGVGHTLAVFQRGHVRTVEGHKVAALENVARPVVWWSGLGLRYTAGPASALKRDVAVITRPKQLAAAWKRLGMKAAVPSVDFDAHFVVVVTKPLGLSLAAPFGHLSVDAKGNAMLHGLPAHADDRGSIAVSSTLAVFPRRGVKSVEGKKLPRGPG